jgi:TatA/E family protein of Tat protein translocase
VLNIGWGEMLVILLVAMIVFGPNRLPEIARSVGKFIRNFQQETNRAISDLKAGIDSPTAGIFDTPDADVTAETEAIDPEATQQFTPAQEIAAATAVAARPRARSSAPRTRSRARSTTTSKKRPATKRAAAAPKKKPASKRAASARRSPKKS